MIRGLKVGSAAAIITAATALIAPWEGLRTTAYRDIIGIPTVCYGETRGVKMGDSYTPAECRRMLEEGVEDFYREIEPCMPKALPVETASAFVSLAYNIGSSRFCSSDSIQGAFKRHDLVAACNAILLFDKARNPKTKKLEPVRGLTNRRRAEHKTCLEGLG